MKNHISINLSDVQVTLNKMGKVFDTHIFIDQFKLDFPDEYVSFVNGYKTIPTGNAQIGKFLSKYRVELHIESLGRTTSTNIYGGKTGCEKWGKI